MGTLHLVDARTVTGAVLDLVVAAARAEPSWLPTVDVASTTSVHDWFAAKVPWRGVAAQGDDGRVVGYLAARQGTTELVADLLAPLAAPCGWVELCRAVVHPDWRRRGTLAALVAHLGGPLESAGARLWLTCVTGSPAQSAWESLGFSPVATVTFPADVDDRPGTLAVRPLPH